MVSSGPAVGAITISPLVFNSNIGSLNTAFYPIAVGTTTISITQPADFLPPAGKASVVATVNPSRGSGCHDCQLQMPPSGSGHDAVGAKLGAIRCGLLWTAVDACGIESPSFRAVWTVVDACGRRL
ncbi:MAG: hypothetical protein GY722_11475 [bacterium]|nr:hypothetical protein [bacterium]